MPERGLCEKAYITSTHEPAGTCDAEDTTWYDDDQYECSGWFCPAHVPMTKSEVEAWYAEVLAERDDTAPDWNELEIIHSWNSGDASETGTTKPDSPS